MILSPTPSTRSRVSPPSLNSLRFNVLPKMALWTTFLLLVSHSIQPLRTEPVRDLDLMLFGKVPEQHLWREFSALKRDPKKSTLHQADRIKIHSGHYNYRQGINPFEQNISIVDCGDFPISPFDNGLAFAQMEEWYARLLNREVKSPESGIVSKKVRGAYSQPRTQQS